MKKIILSMILAVCAVAVSAQRATSSSTTFFSAEKTDQPVTFGVRVGGNLSSIGGDLGKVYDKSKFGFHAGVSVDIPILKSFGINTGLYYVTKGAKFTDGDDEGDIDYKTATYKVNTGYLEIPILASYRYNFTDDVRLEIDLGPYIAYGINGKYKVDGGEAEDREGDGVDFFGDNGYKRFDAGLAFGAAVTFSQFYVGLHYEVGLANMARNVEVEIGDVSVKTDVTAKNNNFLFTVGYNF